MSETALCRDRLKEYIIGDFVFDLGAGGSSCLPGKAITLDMPQPYCPPLEGMNQILRGDYRKLEFICDEAATTVWSSHCIEDWHIPEQIIIVHEWKRILRCFGNLIIIAPDEKVYAEHCRKSGQCHNDNHKLVDYSLELFKREVLPHTGRWEILYENPLVDTYSWNLVLQKLP